jgi:uncharacterized repeat protein (TIGR01451 family)
LDVIGITALSNETRVNTTTAGDQWNYYWSIRTVAVQPDGSFIKVWIDVGGLDGQGYGIFMQRYNASGVPVGGEVQVNTHTAGNQDNATIAVAPDGSFIVGWDGPGTANDVWGQRFSPTGAFVGDEFLLSQTIGSNQKYPELGFAADGSYVTAWVDGGRTVMQRYDARGNTIGSEMYVTSASGDVILDSLNISASGAVVLTWTDNGSTSGDVYGQLFDANLVPTSAVFQINQYTTGTQQYSIARTDGQGNFVVVWESAGQDGSGNGIYGRLYNASGTPLGNEFAITPNTTDDQFEPQIAMDAAGNFVVAWSDMNNRDGGGPAGSWDGTSVWMQLFDRTGAKVGSELMVNQSTTGYQAYPVVDMNDAGRLVVAWEGNGTQAGQVDSYGVYARRYQLTTVGSASMSATPTTVVASDLITVTMALTASVSTPNVSPNPLSVAGTNGVFATLVSGPTPLTATVGTTATTFQWVYRATAPYQTGVLTFGGNADDASGANTFPYATSNSVTVNAALSIRDLTAANLVGDSNVYSQPEQGPRAFTIGAEICNSAGVTLTDVMIYLGNGITPGVFPTTTMSLWQTYGTYQGAFSLTMLDTDRSDATRPLIVLSPGECQHLYWQVAYDTLDAFGKATWGNAQEIVDDLRYNWTVWGTARMAGITRTAELNDSARVRNEISANANKIQPSGASITVSPGTTVQVGQRFTVTVNGATFGNIGAGYDADRDGLFDFDFWHQPIGEPTWNSNAFRLLDIQSQLTFSGGSCPLNGQTLPYDNEPYLTRLFTSGSCTVDANYSYAFVAYAAGSGIFSPYQEAASGADNEKYNGDYCGDNPGGSVCFTMTAAGSALQLSKSASPQAVAVGSTVTWTLTYTNIALTPVGDPATGSGVVIQDAIPANSTYVTNSATCAVYPCTVYYSADGGATWSAAQPAASSVTHLLWHIEQVLPAGASGRVSFRTSVNTGTPNNTRINNTGDVRVDNGPVLDTADAFVCVGSCVVATIDKDTTTPLVNAGGQVTYTIVVFNDGSLGSLSAAANVQISDTLPGGFTYASSAVGLSGGATRPSTSNPSVGASNLIWGTFTIPINGRVAITVTANVAYGAPPGVYDNTAYARGDGGLAIDDLGTEAQDGDTPAGQDPEPDEDVTVRAPVLLIDKDTTTPAVVAGGQVTYTVVVSNTGDLAATGVTISDTLPAGFTYASGSAVEISATRTSASNPAAGAGTLNWGTWTINPGGAVRLTFQVNVAAGVAGGTYDNTASASASNYPTTDDLGPVGQDAGTPAGQDPEPDEDVTVYLLSFSKSSSAGGFTQAGGLITYTLVVRNDGPATITGVSVSDPLPANTSYVNPPGMAVTALAGGPGTYSDDFDPTPASFSGTDGATDWSGTPWVDSQGDGPSSGNVQVALHQADLALRFTNANGLSVSRAANLTAAVTATLRFDYYATGLKAGEVINVQVRGKGSGWTTLLAIGSDTATYTPFSADIIAYAGSDFQLQLIQGNKTGGIVYIDDVQIAFNNRGWQTSAGGAPPNLVTAGAGYALQGGERMTITYPVQVNGGVAGGTNIVNTASLTTTQVPGPLTATTTDVVQAPALLIDKDATTPVAASGGQVTYTIVVRNTGGSAATGVTISDTLPAGFTYTSTTSAVVSNGSRTSTSNPTVGATTPTWGAWTLNPGGAVTVTFVADVAVSVTTGTYDNTAYAVASNHSLIDDLGTQALDTDTLPTDTPETDEDVTVENPAIGIAKTVKSVTSSASGIFTVAYTLTVQNLGDVILSSVQVTDDLSLTFSGAVSYTVVSVASAAFTENPAYDGDTDLNLLMGGDSLAVGASASIELTVRFNPDINPGPYTNSAYAYGTSPTGARVYDISQDGVNPDPDGNGDGQGNDDPTPLRFARVYGHIFEDTDGNGAQNGLEPSWANIQVVITDSLGVARTVTTDASGNYTATVPAGNTTADVVEASLPPAYTQTAGTDPTTVNVPVGSTTSLGDDGYRPPLATAQIGDRVWWDVDGDGVQDGDEPGIPGVTVVLTDSLGIAATTTTDDAGQYLFPSLTAGAYSVAPNASGLPNWYATNPTPPLTTTTIVADQVLTTADFGFNIVSGYTLTKQLNTPDPTRPGEMISFTIRITNTGATWITALQLTDAYNNAYLTYGFANTFAIPDSDDHVNDGGITWSDVLSVTRGGPGALAPGASTAVTISFTGRNDTHAVGPNGTRDIATIQNGRFDPDGPAGGIIPRAVPSVAPASDDAYVRIYLPTGLTLIDFKATARQGEVMLTWRTANEAQILGFNLLRRAGNGPAQRINGEIIPAEFAGSNQGAAYTYRDKPAAGAYAYLLETIQLDGSRIQANPAAVQVGR